MDIATVESMLDSPDRCGQWLRAVGASDLARGHANLMRIATSGVTLDLVLQLCEQFAKVAPRLSDPDRALNNLDSFFAATRNPLSLAALFERDRQALPILLEIFSTSQHLSDLLITDREAYDLLRMTEGQPVARDTLVEEIAAETANAADEREVATILRRSKRRETLRICYGDLIEGQDLKTVTEQISFLADALVESAVRTARRRHEEQRGIPRGPTGDPAQFVVLALGKLGGRELNYSSDIDLIFLYDFDGLTDGKRRRSNAEFFDAMARDVIKLLSEVTDLGAAYRVDMRLRPQGQQGPLVMSLESALHYYDVIGRTWERQAMVKARPIAGDLSLGKNFLAQLEPWVYRRYLSRADITGIKALKRRIEHRAQREGADDRNVKTGRGGLRDIEFVVQFLQLLNGGELPELRTGNTLEALERLAKVGCLADQESRLLEDNYRFLRKIEHRLQIMFDLQTHVMPPSAEEQRKLAIRLGYAGSPEIPPREALAADYQRRTELNRRVLDHVLHQAFRDDAEPEPEVDLVLDPEPHPELVRSVLSQHGFQDIPAAYANLMTLSAERIRFLSTRRCRHFLAAIAPRLLAAIAHTPDPDSTLVNLVNVSDSLGGKGVLWELFSFHPPSLRLYVEICASSPYLSEILTSHPGMIDELMDSLLLDKLPTLQWLDQRLTELCKGAEDLDPILHSFKNAQQLRVGVRDILGKEDIEATTASLADIAQACLSQIAVAEKARLEEKFGQPIVAEGERAGQPSEMVIIGVGKFGGREPNYHSDLDVIFLYDADGSTRGNRRSRQTDETTNQHFFSELSQRIIKTATHMGPNGRLYEIDPRLRPTGRSGALATSLDELARYFAEGEGQLWERLALAKARPVYGSPEAAARAMRVIEEVVYDKPWEAAGAAQIYDMRQRMQETARPTNLKRGPGGIVDVEFIAQTLQLKHQGKPLSIRTPGTLPALAALAEAGHLAEEDYRLLTDAYRFLRNVEARLRLLNTAARHDIPDEPRDLAKLARLLHYSDPEALRADCARVTGDVRRVFDRIVGHNSIAPRSLGQKSA